MAIIEHEFDITDIDQKMGAIIDLSAKGEIMEAERLRVEILHEISAKRIVS